MTTCYTPAMILTDEQRGQLAELQAKLDAAIKSGDTAAGKAATDARDHAILEVHRAHRGRRGLMTELATLLGVHRTTVHRSLNAARTGSGRHAYRPEPVRQRATRA